MRRIGHLMLATLLVVVSASTTAEESFAAVDHPIPIAPSRYEEQCAFCTPYQYGGSWAAEYYGACYGEAEPDCSTCPYVGSQQNCSATAIYNYNPCDDDCGLESPVEDVVAAIEASDAKELAKLMEAAPGEIIVNRERGAIQLVAACGSVVGSYPISADLSRQLQK